MRLNKINHLGLSLFTAVRILSLFSMLLFIACSGGGNNSDTPQSENANRSPQVNAGENQTISLPTNFVQLNATATDDSLPDGSTLTYTWVQESGPGTTTFDDPNDSETIATFDIAGIYVLQLTASDSELSALDTVSVTVNTQDEEINASSTMTLKGRHIIDPTGKIFIPRGPEIVISNDIDQIDLIAEAGANAVRVLLVLDAINNQTPEHYDDLIGRAVQHDLVVWISLFTWNDDDERRVADAFGGGRLAGMDDYIPMWERDWLFNICEKYKDHIIIDAMQEYITPEGIEEGSDESRAAWTEAAIKNVKALREKGYTQPLEIMTNFEGRDLYAIIEHAEAIMDADPLKIDGQGQTLFGWQAYWGDEWYRNWQGELLRGERTTAIEAVELYVSTVDYPIMVGLLDGYDVPDQELLIEVMPECARLNVGWLWWEWNDLVDPNRTPGPGTAVENSDDGFAGAVLANFNSTSLVSEKVFFIGNSLIDNINYLRLEDLASGRGKDYIWSRQMIPGAPLHDLWEYPDASNVEEPYGYVTNAFPNYQWDSIIFEPFDRLRDEDVIYIQNFVDLAITNSPNTQFYIYSRWPRKSETLPNTATVWNELFDRTYTGGWDGTFETREYFEILRRDMSNANPELKPFLIVPVGDVMYSLNNRLAAGEVDGYSSIWDFYTDDIHLNEIGSYMLSVIFYATIFTENPIGLPNSNFRFADDIPDDIANLIQDVAWSVVSTHPYSGVSQTN